MAVMQSSNVSGLEPKPYIYDDNTSNSSDSPEERKKKQGQDRAIAKLQDQQDDGLGIRPSGLALPSNYGPRTVQDENALPDNYDPHASNQGQPNNGEMSVAGRMSGTPQRYDPYTDKVVSEMMSDQKALSDVQGDIEGKLKDYHPTKTRQFLATLAGIGTGVLSRNPVLGLNVGRNINDAPLRDQLQPLQQRQADIQTRMSNYKDISGLSTTLQERNLEGARNDISRGDLDVRRSEQDQKEREQMAVPGVGPGGTKGTYVIPKLAPKGAPGPQAGAPQGLPQGPRSDVARAAVNGPGPGPQPGMQPGPPPNPQMSPGMPIQPQMPQGPAQQPPAGAPGAPGGQFFEAGRKFKDVSVAAKPGAEGSIPGYDPLFGADILQDEDTGEYFSRDPQGKLASIPAQGVVQINPQSRGSMRAEAKFSANEGIPTHVTKGLGSWTIGPGGALSKSQQYGDAPDDVQQEAKTAWASYDRKRADKRSDEVFLENQRKTHAQELSEMKLENVPETAKTQAVAGYQSLDQLQIIEDILKKKPQLLGPIMGRFENYSQKAGTTFGLAPEDERDAARLENNLVGLFARELRAQTGTSRPNKEVIDYFKSASPQLYQDKNMFAGFVDGVKDNAALAVNSIKNWKGNISGKGPAVNDAAREVHVTMKDGTINVYDKGTKKFLRTEGK